MQSVFNNSKISNSQEGGKSHIWKANDGKAQKNGPHSNIYWVKVFRLSYNKETTSE